MFSFLQGKNSLTAVRLLIQIPLSVYRS